MRVYRLRPDSGRYKDLVVRWEHDAGKLVRLTEGVPLGTEWEPVEVEVLDDAENRRRLPGDFPSLENVVPVLSSRAVRALRDLLEPNGELLPLVCEDGEYTAFNLTRIIDALDADLSELRYLTPNMLIEVPRHEFKPERLAGAVIFKIPQFRKGGRIYVTDGFVQRVKEAGLLGFRFEEVWTDEPE